MPHTRYHNEDGITLATLSSNEVTDPDQVFADVTKSDFDRFISEYRPFENQLIERSQTDTTLVDAVAPTVQAQTDIAQGVARRNRERFGLAETGAMRRERMRATDRAQSLNLAGGFGSLS